MRLHLLARAAQPLGLMVMGHLHRADDAGGPCSTVLLGTGPGFWPVFTAAPEYRDGRPDPVDRWSKRVLGALARRFDAGCDFPSDGPPYPPFIAWALASGRFAQSPVGMLVHDRAGLMISLRGALHLRPALPPPPAPSRRFDPCAPCPAPCTRACPVGALGAGAGYDLARCHGYLDREGAQSCMMQGCAARLACPLSRGAGRVAAQSALHMKAFHPA